MKNGEKLDILLKRTLTPTVKPSETLNQKIISQLNTKVMGNDGNKLFRKRRIPVALVAALLILTLSAAVYATWNLLAPNQVAEHFGDKTLSDAFKSKDAIVINESIASGEYIFTLHGIVSGEGLSDFGSSAEESHPDRTYAVVSIAKQDGSNMPDTQDEEYNATPFFISPLIKGQKPWLVNIATMNGGYSSFVIDGVMYRLIECDGVEMFADRGLYLCISTSTFYDINAFNYDEETGEVSVNNEYDGANALFGLPLDTSKADYEKAEAYLKELLKEPEKTDVDRDEMTNIYWDEMTVEGDIIQESIREVTYDKNGNVYYDYEDITVSTHVETLFEDDQTGLSSMVCIIKEDDNLFAIQFLRDSNGVITGRVIKMN
ncbi:hypothetical protein DW1_0029 [Proteiniborus sp. DW1]|uniref:hypothetical protein n=1 Tax=Proteiniborus sp. DW1 TaxID=1889883 RepID=UPI00092DF6C8|nr:hypothetical protein [Proteiniborus sp. DW1]SCG81650.1 hypothetical protein DW1_0029 [Proteiniborus sp. DW1]